MVTVANIGWSAYGGYEGPFFYGSNRYVAPENATFNDKCFAVVASSEGTMQSINMYDRAIISVGAIQWTELTNNKVSEMIGYVASRCGAQLVLEHLAPALKASGAEFKQNAAGQFRFFFGDTEVKGEGLARRLFSNGSGKKGTWTDNNKFHAKTWAACVANLFAVPEAAQAQVDFTAPKLRSFVLKNAEKILFAPGTPESGIQGATKAILVGYAINLPAVADKIFANANAASKYPRWSEQWCLDIMYGLALTSGVDIWPARYNAKRASLEKYFDVVLPKNSTELAKRAWHSTPPDQVKAPVLVPPPVVKPMPQPPVVTVPVPPPVTPEITEPVIIEEPPKVEEKTPEVVLQGPDEVAIKEETTKRVLQWLPMSFGFVWQLINWLIHLIRGK